MVLNEKYDFLNNVELSELKGKDDDFVIFKGIKFNKEERELLQFIQWKGEKFSNYVKQLIEKDMRETIEGNGDRIEFSTKPQIDESYLMSLIEKALDNRENKKDIKINVETEANKNAKKALGALGISKRGL